jgi:hypothetical protein
MMRAAGITGYATHADDVGAPLAAGERPARTAWRVSFGRFALTERDAPVETWTNSEIGYRDHHPDFQNLLPPAT